MAAGQYNFTIEQGVTVKKQFTYKNAGGTPVNIGTGYHVRMQIRDTIASETKIGDFNTETNNFLSVIETSGSAISGTIELLIPATSTSLYAFDTAVYDLELEHAATKTVTRLLQGRIKLSKEVTRD
jgi:Neuraminidase (sialidase)